MTEQSEMRALTKEEILAQQQTEAERQRQAQLAAYIAERDALRAAARLSARTISND